MTTFEVTLLLTATALFISSFIIFSFFGYWFYQWRMQKKKMNAASAYRMNSKSSYYYPFQSSKLDKRNDFY